MCVYTLGRLGEKPATAEMRPRGPGANHTNTLAVSLNPPPADEERVKNIETNPSLFAYGRYHPRCCLITVSISQSFFGTGLELQLWLNLSPQSSGEVASGNLFCHRLGLRALPNTDNW